MESETACFREMTPADRSRMYPRTSSAVISCKIRLRKKTFQKRSTFVSRVIMWASPTWPRFASIHSFTALSNMVWVNFREPRARSCSAVRTHS